MPNKPEFTAEQHDAAEFRAADACVIAGPGSGKTTVLVERYRRLMEDRGFEPREILAITFTEKAAANMKARLGKIFEHDAVRRRDLESAWVSTIHGFCFRLLRENAIAAGLDPRFTVLSPREAESLQWECLTAALNEFAGTRHEDSMALIEALQVPSLAGDLKDVYDAIRSAGVPLADVRNKPNPSAAAAVEASALIQELRALVNAWPWKMTTNQSAEKERLLEWCQTASETAVIDFESFARLWNALNLNLSKVPQTTKESIRELRDRVDAFRRTALDRHAAPFRAMIFDVLDRFEDEYRSRKKALSRVDFNDLERFTIALLKTNPDVQRRVHGQFRQVMLDEFQDVNGQQAELIRLVRAPDVFFGVGDRNQSIYGFRHAKPEIFLTYRDEVHFRGGHSVSLLHNFRSREAILRFVESALAGRDGIEERELIAGSKFGGKDEPSIEILRAIDVNAEAGGEREAVWIAHRVLELLRTLQIGRPGETRAPEFRDFAVLCRNSESMPAILAAFDRAGIPSVCGRRESFLLSREGLDITALIGVIANPRDSISLAAVLRGPLVGVSDETLLRLRLAARSLTGGLNRFPHDPDCAVIAEPDRSRVITFCRNLERWRHDVGIVPLDILLSRALRDCGVDWMPGTIDAANIESFLDLARTAGKAMSLPSFLLEVESLSRAAGAESELSDEDQGNCIQVMTAHAAKGLEFPITIVAGMERGSRRDSRSVSFTEEHGLGVKWRNPGKKNGDGDSWFEANSKVSEAREDEEENRLLYVAMTRAIEHLVLSWSEGKRKPSNWAKLIAEHLGLLEMQPSAEPYRLERDGFSVSVRIVDSDPPAAARAWSRAEENGIELVAPPVVRDRHETTATVTSLAVFAACPRKYYIQRSLGWSTGRFRRFEPEEIEVEDLDGEDTADLSASRIGSAVHAILAGMEPEDDAPQARELAAVFRRSELGRRAEAACRSEREWAFIGDIDGTIVRGTIDLWFEAEDGGIHIVDYKTDEVTADQAQARAAEYAPQLALYAVALERALGKRPRSAWLHFLRPDRVVEVAIDDAAIAAARALVAGLRQAQDLLRFDLREGGHCRVCSFYRTLCPAGRGDAILVEA
ncbi:MAG TPA: UvrD-helicase domain-containing protein [Bryobacteraceae bacterium]|nr:UvrD-helicase domain-containing protein [Bryobacteraceae bacterium]